MNFLSFQASNVHGYLNFDIKFNNTLTFLVGINGSGKTTALKLIQGLITPSFEALNSIEYDSISLTCILIDASILEISAKKSIHDSGDETIVLTANIDSDTTNHLSFTFSKATGLLGDQFLLNKKRFEISSFTSYVRQLDNPFFLGLDRKINHLRENTSSTRISRTTQALNRRHAELSSTTIDSSLRDVQEIVYNYFRQMSQTQLKISDEFKRRILSSAFKFSNEVSLYSEFDYEKISESLARIEGYKKDIIDAAKRIDVEGIDDEVREFFSQLDNISSVISKHILASKSTNTRHNKESGINSTKFYLALTQYIANTPQIKRMEAIIGYSEHYQNQVRGLQKPIKNLEALVNNFFKEANKNIVTEGSGDIKVRLPNQRLSNIIELSSGEKQILIMLTHLIFYENLKKPGVFIIDEPEVSLHLAWQEIFVESIIKASPNTQFILATHSPAIIGGIEREIFCQDLTVPHTKLLN